MGEWKKHRWIKQKKDRIFSSSKRTIQQKGSPLRHHLGLVQGENKQIKTNKKQLSKVTELIESLHPYEVPEIITLNFALVGAYREESISSLIESIPVFDAASISRQSSIFESLISLQQQYSPLLHSSPLIKSFLQFIA